MKRQFLSAIGASLLCAPILSAQPQVYRVTTETVYAGGDYPEERVAQGSIFRVYGHGLGVGNNAAGGFPLPLDLAGLSLRVTAGDTTVDVPILESEVLPFPGGLGTTIRAVLPSRTPVGDALIVATYNGVTGPPHGFRVTRRDFGLYDSIHNFSSSGGAETNTFSQPARPGQVVGLQGTGLGGVEGDEVAGPLPGNLEIPGLDVLVGNTLARILYAGRSECCAGIDEIRFEVPQGIEGCNVPVRVRYSTEGDTTARQTNYGFVNIAIAASGDTCSDPFGTPGPIRYGRISISDGPYDGSFASFGTGGGNVLPPMGTCGNAHGRPPEPYLDAGSEIRLDTPQGLPVNLFRLEAPYPVNSYQAPAPARPLQSGTYTASNSVGGVDVGPFFTSAVLPQTSFAWTNKYDVNVTRDRDVRVTWTGGDQDGYVLIRGMLAVGGYPSASGILVWADYQGYFSCVERAAKGVFTVPDSAIWTEFTRRADHLELTVTPVVRQTFDVAGFDLAEFLLIPVISRIITF